MLGDVIYEEKGQTTGIRVLSAEGGVTKVEVTLQTEGKVLGVKMTSIWTYWSMTRGDGSVYGQGEGVMTTENGDIIQLKGSGGAKKMNSDGSINYRGAVYFHTSSENFAKLNGAVGVHEYDVDASGNTAAKIWEWS